MKPTIQVKILGDQAIVRKVLHAPRECYGLKSDGYWVHIPEGQAYPKECLLQITKHDEKKQREKPIIQVKILGNQAIVHTTLHSLKPNGYWVLVPKGQAYPKECLLQATKYDEEKHREETD